MLKIPLVPKHFHNQMNFIDVKLISSYNMYRKDLTYYKTVKDHRKKYKKDRLTNLLNQRAQPKFIIARVSTSA